MFTLTKVTTWLETRWLNPSYSCWVILGLTACFLLAAANTMAGWLYVLCGVGISLLLVSGWLTLQNFHGLEMVRLPTYPVSAQESLSLALEVRNLTHAPKGMMQLCDRIPTALGVIQQTSIETLSPQGKYCWYYAVETTRRGVYRWETIELRSGAPLGLFWCRRQRSVPVEVVVYPQILPILRCPLLDQVDQTQQHRELYRDLSVSIGSEGATRSLRPYRWGDPMRLVHWRTSARYNELRIRELERMGNGQQFIIALDTNSTWHEDDFEQAVIAAASLYTYAQQHHETVLLWTAEFGCIQSIHEMQNTLAQIMPTSGVSTVLPSVPLIWLTANANSLTTLPEGSRFVCWPNAPQIPQKIAQPLPSATGLWIDTTRPLSEQLQQTLS